MKSINRRQFLKTTAGFAGALALTSCASPLKKTAADQVLLGATGLKISRLGIGCGTHGGRVQRDLGTDGFNSLIHYAFDHGITYLDTADSYRTHPFIRDAIKGLPREKLFILSKIGGRPENPLQELDRFRQELGTDYIDCLLLHCKIEANWDETHERVMDALEDAKAKGIIRAHGVSCHSLPATTKAAQLDWVDVNLVRVNPQGNKIDTADERVFDQSTPDHLPPVLEQLAVMRENGHGIIGMKIIGEGDFTDLDDRIKSMNFAMKPGLVDAVTIGVKSKAEIDEAIANMNNALALQS
ncbi:aldo/keto reductase [candidate division KSB1 bacterium]|nr:aldo/keto reductase [candidate division KSB1 bacterium]RQW08799.1 MAG: twin-arginine translocation signal domain-containing protein [candidate division KSB1 bacterium]